MGIFSIRSDVMHSMSCLLSTPGSEQTFKSEKNLKCPDNKQKQQTIEKKISAAESNNYF